MTPQIGLYYPFIHFKDDAWLKLTALYWDKMGRIVPPSYQPVRDTETVRRLADELGYIVNFSPADTSSHVGERFAQVLREGMQQPLPVLGQLLVGVLLTLSLTATYVAKTAFNSGGAISPLGITLALAALVTAGLVAGGGWRAPAPSSSRAR